MRYHSLLPSSVSPCALKFPTLKFPTPAFHQITTALNGTQLSMLIQLRTRHAPLLHHFRRINITPSPNCPRCQHGPRQFHVTQCPAYDTHRARIYHALGRRSRNITALLALLTAIPHLRQYVASTRRFQHPPNEIAPTLDQIKALQYLTKTHKRRQRRQ